MIGPLGSDQQIQLARAPQALSRCRGAGFSIVDQHQRAWTISVFGKTRNIAWLERQTIKKGAYFLRREIGHFDVNKMARVNKVD